jgi:hypothetical protein
MSTKATVASGQNFHLYQEVLDDNYIYLSLEGVQYEASYNRITVPIPVHIWEVIRQYQSVDLSFVNYTDDELHQYVENQVDKRLERYQNAAPNVKGLIGLAGSLTFGNVNHECSQQIENGIAYYTKLREHQQQISQAIAELSRVNSPK